MFIYLNIIFFYSKLLMGRRLFFLLNWPILWSHPLLSLSTKKYFFWKPNNPYISCLFYPPIFLRAFL
ncbi:unnamed protein product [Meloidogyne enterolobii]|uniref:Uncharacterized protein n=1 Tax=Meloidogyne enterolobii TaxID=390850 RepID=A0ACB0XX56_MELEN